MLNPGCFTHSRTERAGTLDKSSLSRLTELRSEVERIKKTKEAYVAAHPEHRHLVFKEKDKASNNRPDDEAGRETIFDSKGRVRDPKRSVYYDPVLNPFGVPPPGMPYRERRELSEST